MQFKNIICFTSLLLSQVLAAPVEKRSNPDDDIEYSTVRYPVYHLLDDEAGTDIAVLHRRDIDPNNLPPGAAYSTVTTTVDGQFGTYLEVVYTSTIRPATTYVVTQTFYSTITLGNGQVTTISSVSDSTTTESAVYATDPPASQVTTSAAPSSSASAPSVSTSTSLTSSPSTTSDSVTSQITSSPSVVTASDSLSVSFASTSESSLSYTPYYTETDDGTCIVYYAEDDETESYSDDTPYTTQTLTSVVATITITQS
ncbi:DEKNAAC100766 [Brettanomyces naardenensis]|uniref:DEKNAAC100766 n=1 Tax=Brettanomyces naardenensis TaxID=13370 RepID=A0A448YF39_BRENA|nr:DEKNAAC100766 [Brettanomyces naardenensis]